MCLGDGDAAGGHSRGEARGDQRIRRGPAGTALWPQGSAEEQVAGREEGGALAGAAARGGRGWDEEETRAVASWTNREERGEF